MKTASNRSAKLIFNKTASGLFEFCNNKGSGGIVDCRGQLAKMFDYSTATHRAHHVIPWTSRNNDLVQRAAEGGLFHPNMKGNGKILTKQVHGVNHDSYITLIEGHFDEIFRLNPNISSKEASDEIFKAIESIKNQFDAGKGINDIILP